MKLTLNIKTQIDCKKRNVYHANTYEKEQRIAIKAIRTKETIRAKQGHSLIVCLYQPQQS